MSGPRLVLEGPEKDAVEGAISAITDTLVRVGATEGLALNALVNVLARLTVLAHADQALVVCTYEAACARVRGKVSS